MTLPAPQSKQECLAKWRSRGGMIVPSKAGNLADVEIVHLFETTAVNGLPLDFVISARKTTSDPILQFVVLFSDDPPSGYGIPALWYSTTGQLHGWLKAS